MGNLVKFSGEVHINIEDIAYDLTRAEAALVIQTIDEVVCDMDFTIQMFKFFVNELKKEGSDNAHIMELIQNMEIKNEN